MKILVTGGAGFIGSHLTPLLLASGMEVTVLDNLSTGRRENIPAGASFTKMDIRGMDTVRAMSAPYDAIVHLAAQTTVGTSIDDPVFDADENIMGLLNVLEAARQNGARVIYASTAAAYGDVDESHLPVREDEPLAPLSFYGLTKVTGERYLALYAANFDLRYIVLRFANVYGERQGDGGEGGVISIFARLAAAGEPLTIYGDGHQTRDFIYAGDIARGILAALRARETNYACNLSGETEESLVQLTEHLGAAAGRALDVTYAPARPGDIYRSILSRERAGERLGWAPEMPLEDGLARVYEWQKAKK